MLESIDKVISQTRKKLQLALDHPALTVFDVLKVHRCDSVLEKLCQHHIH